MKCAEKVSGSCRSCKGPVVKTCNAKAAYVVFYGDAGCEPEGFCVAHMRSMGINWITGRIAIKNVRKRDGNWEVRVNGKWLREDSEEYCDFLAKKLGVA